MGRKINEMLDRPIVMEKVVTFMRERLPRLTKNLDQMEVAANERRLPIIPHETVAYLNQLVAHERPQQILEIGTAIAFSAKLMAQYAPVTTIERNPVMSEEARRNICLLYTSPSPRDISGSRMPSSA